LLPNIPQPAYSALVKFNRRTGAFGWGGIGFVWIASTALVTGADWKISPPKVRAKDGQSPLISIKEVSGYRFGGYAGEFKSPPHADLDATRAVIIRWPALPCQFVFSHEGSYCPWFEFPSGAAQCFQFFEGNDGWAELFNNFGRKEENSFVEIMKDDGQEAWVHWTYFGVNQESGQKGYRGSEDFHACANGLILRRQSFQTLRPGDPHGYAREPIEMIGMCPRGKLWRDVLEFDEKTGESHALAVLDVFSTNRYDVYWKRKPDSLAASTGRREGCPWDLIDNSKGVIVAIPFREGYSFCVMGDAGGFNHETTRIKEHTFKDTGGNGWGSTSWDHWPIGWLNSQANEVTPQSLALYPNHFSPAGMDLWGLKNEEAAGKSFYSLMGISGPNLEKLRRAARTWLEQDERKAGDPQTVAELPALFP
jgi:hypothetical protein